MAVYSNGNLPHKVIVPHTGSWQWMKDQRFDWCRENCQGNFRGAMFKRTETVWHFKNEHDATLFALRWS